MVPFSMTLRVTPKLFQGVNDRRIREASLRQLSFLLALSAAAARTATLAVLYKQFRCLAHC